MRVSFPTSPPLRGARDPGALAALRARIRAIEAGGPPHPSGRTVASAAAQEVVLGVLSSGPARGALHDVHPAAFFDEPAAAGFALALAGLALRQAPGALVWVRRRGGFSFGTPYGPGLAGFGLAPERCLFVTLDRREATLAAAEEAVRTPGLGAVIAEPGALLDLTASRRLQLAAEAGRGLLLLLRPAGAEPALAARTRWRAAAAPSDVPSWAGMRPAGAPAPLGCARWRIVLERGAVGNEAAFDLEHRHEEDGVRLAPLVCDRAGEAVRRRA